MRVGVFKDFRAIRFVRCVSENADTGVRAGGAGFTLGEAFAKCESEAIEREFSALELKPQAIFPLGIASHPSVESARERALQEAVETLCLAEIQQEQRFRCFFRIRLRQFALGVARTSIGYICLIRGMRAERTVAAHSAGKSLIPTLLKAWEEFQSMRFFRVKGQELAHFTKANQLFSSDELARLPFDRVPGAVYRPKIQGIIERAHYRSGRPIIYFIKPGEHPICPQS